MIEICIFALFVILVFSFSYIYLTTPHGMPPYDSTPMEDIIDSHTVYWEVKTDEVIVRNNYRWKSEVSLMLRSNQKPWYKAYKIEKWKKNKYKNNSEPVLYDYEYERNKDSDFIKDDIGNNLYV